MRLIILAALLTLFMHTHWTRGATGGAFDIGFGTSLLRDSGGAEQAQAAHLDHLRSTYNRYDRERRRAAK